MEMADLRVTNLYAKALSRGTSFTCERGYVFFNIGDVVDKAFFLTEGKVRVTMISSNGCEITLCYFCPGDLFGEPSMIMETPSGVLTSAVTDCKVVKLSRQEYFDLIKCDENFANLCIKSLANKSRFLGKQVALVSLEDRYSKIASALLYFCNQKPYASRPRTMKPAVAITVTHKELAEFTGTNRVTVSRVLQDFEVKGFIRKERGKILVLGTEQLRRITQT